VVKNLQAVMAGREPSATYDGYASCPLTTSRNRMLLYWNLMLKGRA
jgi:sulfide:quinone oxidoreductase